MQIENAHSNLPDLAVDEIACKRTVTVIVPDRKDGLVQSLVVTQKRTLDQAVNTVFFQVFFDLCLSEFHGALVRAFNEPYRALICHMVLHRGKRGRERNKVTLR
jgi:hypothetical protein